MKTKTKEVDEKIRPLLLCKAIQDHRKSSISKGIYYNASNRQYMLKFFSDNFHQSMFIIQLI